MKTNPDFKRVQPLPVLSDLFAPVVAASSGRSTDGTPSDKSLRPTITDRLQSAKGVGKALSQSPAPNPIASGGCTKAGPRACAGSVG